MKTAYINGILLDGTPGMTPVSGKVIVVEDDIISAVTDSVPSGCKVVDLGGKYILPGLINLHVHIPASGKPKKKPTDAKKTVKLVTANALTRKVLEFMYKSYAKTELLSGVTTFRSVGGVESYDTWLRDGINSGKFTGPAILASNMAVSVPGGHMAGSLAYEARTPEEAAAFVEKIAADKPDLIKLMITGGVLDAEKKGEPGVLKMAPELIRAACDKAHEYGLPVSAHVEGTEGMKEALANGVDTIEHGAMPTDETIALFKERNAAFVATFSPVIFFVEFDPDVSRVTETDRFNGQIVFDSMIECVKQCLANGIPVGLGTDTGCPYVTHYDMWREVNYFVKYSGVSPEFALYSATLGNAKITHIDGVTGSIEPGKRADMIVCEGNPLEDLTRLRSLSMVIARGKAYDRPKIKKMARVETELDKYL